ncbi:MAG: hypothetical protein GY822_32465 [Deltaproteobacteria bacterium]|nr:hypothetical protein [Deltaproteobacteria bacterium]
MKKLESIAQTIEHTDIYAMEAEELALFELSTQLAEMSQSLKVFLESIFEMRERRKKRRENREQSAVKLRTRFSHWLLEVDAVLPFREALPYRACPQLGLTQRIRFGLRRARRSALPNNLKLPLGKLTRSLRAFERAVDEEMSLDGDLQIHFEEAMRQNQRVRVYLYRLRPTLLGHARHHPEVYERVLNCRVRCSIPKWMNNADTQPVALPPQLQDPSLSEG